MPTVLSALLVLASIYGVKSAPPPPAPTLREAGSKWAVIAAGSAGFGNYRHQADACHAYHQLVSSGVPKENIILMMQDDVAGSSENPFPNKLYNKPGSDAVDVYDGCNVDYRGEVVTAKLFLSVITGDAANVPKGGKVLKSTSEDRVFLNFVDHGGVGIIAFPNGPFLHAADLAEALATMKQKSMYRELLFYMEACESGSMFPGLPTDDKLFAVTAANAKESSWGYYCSPNDVVNGKHLGTCLGDLFSIAWMEDSDLHQQSETIRTQVQRVTARTNKSHVSTFGDTSFEDEPFGDFELRVQPQRANVVSSHDESAMDVRDIPLLTAQYKMQHAATQWEKEAATKALQAIVAARKADDALFASIAHKVCNDDHRCGTEILERKADMVDMDCHKKLASKIHAACPRRAATVPGGWNDYNMKFSQVLVNACEQRHTLANDVESLSKLVEGECIASAAAWEASTTSVKAVTVPAATPAVAGTKWAVIAAGSAGFMNYRHQADACHAYHQLVSSGVPKENIILMMQDDVAGSSQNPFPNKLYNKPGSDAVDVYEGCNVDYRGEVVTAKLFLSVITGDVANVPKGGKVLKSTSEDRVFLNFVDHGGVGIIAFPNGPFLHAADLAAALATMKQKDMYRELLFYMEACESGSMFPGLPTDNKIFAVTAANAKESSWGYYCSPNDVVNGKHLGTCLGDLFSIAWMEDSDLHQQSETIRTQVQRVTTRTNKSHVSTFGDTTFEDEPFGNFELRGQTQQEHVMSYHDASAMDVRDIPLLLAQYRVQQAVTASEKNAAHNELRGTIAARTADDALFASIARTVCKGEQRCIAEIKEQKADMLDMNCHKALAGKIHTSCPRRVATVPGGWNDYNMQFSQLLVNVCEQGKALAYDVESLSKLVEGECIASSAAWQTSEIVI
jgi:legumain